MEALPPNFGKGQVDLAAMISLAPTFAAVLASEAVSSKSFQVMEQDRLYVPLFVYSKETPERTKPLYNPAIPLDNVGMNFNISLFFTALGLACVLESLPWLLSPAKMRQVLLQLLALSDTQLRTWGYTLLGVGVLLVFLCRI